MTSTSKATLKDDSTLATTMLQLQFLMWKKIKLTFYITDKRGLSEYQYALNPSHKMNGPFIFQKHNLLLAMFYILKNPIAVLILTVLPTL